MKVHLILTENWKEMQDAIKVATEYLKIFDVQISSEFREVDVSNESLYETTLSSTQMKIEQVKSLKTAYIFGLASMEQAQKSDCIGIMVDRSKAIQGMGLYGQQSTLGIKQIIEVYFQKGKKNAYGFEYGAYTLIHELFHALTDYYGIEDTLHAYVNENKSSLDGFKSYVLDKIVKNQYGLLPLVNSKANQLIEFAKKVNLPIRITEGYRTPERQDQLYKQIPKVTNAKAWESMHQYRVAFDIVFTELGYSATPQQWEMIAEYAKTLGFTWGGDWASLVDKPHFELDFGKSLKDFQSNNIDWNKYFDTPDVLVKPETYQFTRDLDIGFSGDDVYRLQIFLNNNGSIVSPTGLGSINNESNYFGDLTKKALADYQKRNGISPALGFFGIKTRTFINSKIKSQ